MRSPSASPEAKPARVVDPAVDDNVDPALAVDYEESEDETLLDRDDITSSRTLSTLAPLRAGRSPSSSPRTTAQALGEQSLGRGGQDFEEGELEDDTPDRPHQRDDRRDHPPRWSISNSSEEQETAAAYAVAPSYVPWLPPATLLSRWKNRRVKGYPEAIFDTGGIRDLGRIPRSSASRFDFFVELFFRFRFVMNKPVFNIRSTDEHVAQAWNQFVANINAKGLTAWIDKLADHEYKFERRSPNGAAMRVHRISRQHGLPCYVAHDARCPMCPSDGPFAEPNRINARVDLAGKPLADELVDAIDQLDHVLDARGRDPNVVGRTGRGGPVRTEPRDQGRPLGGRPAVPTYRRMADTRANERGTDASFGPEPLDLGGSLASPRSSGLALARPPAARAAVERPPLEPGAQAVERLEWQRCLQLEQAARADLEVRLRADLANERLQNRRETDENLATTGRLRDRVRQLERDVQAVRDEHETLVRDHKRVLGLLRAQGVDPGTPKRRRADGTDGGDQRST
jgi:hypothetical protein